MEQSTTQEPVAEQEPKPVNWFKGWRIIASILISFLAVKLLGILGYLVGGFVFLLVLKKIGAGKALAAGLMTGAVVAVLYSAVVMPAINAGHEESKIPPAEVDWEKGNMTLPSK